MTRRAASRARLRPSGSQADARLCSVEVRRLIAAFDVHDLPFPQEHEVDNSAAGETCDAGDQERKVSAQGCSHPLRYGRA